MKNKHVNLIVILIGAFLISACSSGKKQSKEVKKEERVEIEVQKELVTFLAEDGLEVTADLITHENIHEAPFIILFHQAGYSRGEYNETVKRFIDLGYNCLAVDQRSGNEVNGVVNETHKAAVEKGLPTEYIDAMPDLMAAIDYVGESFDTDKILIMGSSYSASLCLIIASQSPDRIHGVLAFSPGEYFKYDDRTIEEYASDILVPVFITSAKGEYDKWKKIYKAIPEGDKVKFVPEVESIHGSRALWKSTEGSDACWKAVEEFIEGI